MTRKQFFSRTLISALAVVTMAASALTPLAAKSSDKTISFEDAAAIALKEVKGIVTQAELDQEAGSLVYEIEVLDKDNIEHDLDIDAYDGEVLTHRKSTRSIRSSKATVLRGATVSAEKAVAAVKKETGASTLVSYELDVERSTPYWEITMYGSDRMEYEATVNAKTGKIVHVESDYDD